jgi:hypothetical protein
MIKSQTSRSLLVLMAAYPVLLIVQGIDFTDMGFNLTNQWLIFRDPTSYQQGYLFYLSNLLGGLWLSLTLPMGLFTIKLGWVLVLYLTLLLCYLVLRRIGPTSGSIPGLATGLLLALVWNTKLGTTWLSYNDLSALCNVAATLLLLMGLTGEGGRLTAAAGATVAVAVFVRFPNVLSLALVAGIPVYAHASAKSLSWVLRHSLFLLAGFVVAAGVILAAMALVGHVEIYWMRLLQVLSAAADDPGYAYSSANLVQLLIRDYRLMGVSLGLSLPFLLFTTWALPRQWYWQLACVISCLAILSVIVLPGAPRLLAYSAAIVTVVACVLSFVLMGRRAPGERARGLLFTLGSILAALVFVDFVHKYSTWVVPGLLYLALGYRLWASEAAVEKLIAALSLIVLVVSPLGSDNGLINAVYGMWLAIPFAVMIAFERIQALVQVPFYQRPSLALAIIVLGAIPMVALDSAYVSTYRDSADRSLMNSSIDSPFFRGVLTTPERAQVVEELMVELPTHVERGDDLLIHGDCTLVHLLTDTRPVLGTTWNGAYTPMEFAERLGELEQGGTRWPVVLLSKGSCRNRDWPKAFSAWETERVKRHVLTEYLARRQYRLLWENSFFEIWGADGVGENAP